MLFESNLLSLFTICSHCGAITEPTSYTIGTFVGILQECNACNFNYKRQWTSQPIVNGTPLGNLLLSASILFSGGVAYQDTKVLNCASISLSTYYTHQNLYLQPNVWNKQQQHMIKALQAFGEPLSLGGDARNDSPGSFCEVWWILQLHGFGA